MKDRHTITSIFTFIFSIILAVITTACSSGGGGGTSTAGVASETVPLGSNIKNVVLAKGVKTEIKFTFSNPGDITSRGDASINVTETLKNVTLSSSPTAKSGKFETLRLLAFALVKEALAAAPETAEVTAHFSFKGDPDVCSSPHSLGPYSVTGSVGSALTSDTSSVPLTQPIEDIVNAGAFDMCVVTTPPVDAYLTVASIAVDFEDCAKPTVNIVGTWEGTYQCNDTGDGTSEWLPISLVITKNKDGSYHYEDGVAAYDGNLCGNKFKHKGGLPGSYTESGTFVFTSSTEATKSSTWFSATEPGVYGTCKDKLTKQTN